MDTAALEGGLKLHPIQLNWIATRELTLKTVRRGSASFKIEPGAFSFTNGHGEYDSNSKTILVAVRGEIGPETPTNEHPLRVAVDLVAQFKVDESIFPSDKVALWAINIAPLILYPYLREHVYGLTTRAGFSSVVLPLLEVPSFKKVDLDYLRELAEAKGASDLLEIQPRQGLTS